MSTCTITTPPQRFFAFTDGACSKNGKPGARASYASIITTGDDLLRNRSGCVMTSGLVVDRPYQLVDAGAPERGIVACEDGIIAASNNRGELLGIISALTVILNRTFDAASNAAPSDAAPSDAAPSDAAPSDAAPSDVAPSDAAPSDVAPSDVAPSDAAVSDAAPSNAAPSNATPPIVYEIISDSRISIMTLVDWLPKRRANNTVHKLKNMDLLEIAEAMLARAREIITIEFVHINSHRQAPAATAAPRDHILWLGNMVVDSLATAALN